MLSTLILFLPSIVMVAGLSTAGLSQSVFEAYKQPEDFKVYLHTVDVGVPFAEKYGHTQIRLFNQRSGPDIALTWGIYDFTKPGFALNFYKGILEYRKTAFYTARANEIYQADGRAVWEDEVFLTPEQKQRLIATLREEFEDQNYLYQYFFDNCTTRPRDIFNAALNDAIRQKFANEASGITFRETVRRHQATTPLSGLFLEVTMNSNLDREMSMWEHMYLPKAFREYMLTFENPDIPNQMLMEFRRMLVEKPTPELSYHVEEMIFYLLFILPLGAIAITLRKRPASAGGRKCLAAYNIVFGFIAFVIGLLMPVSWLTSGHLDLYHNYNMMIFWPVDFLYIYLGISLWRKNQFVRTSIKHQVRRVFLYAHVGFFGAYLMGAPFVVQNIWRVSATWGIALLLLWYANITIMKAEALQQSFHKS